MLIRSDQSSSRPATPPPQKKKNNNNNNNKNRACGQSTTSQTEVRFSESTFLWDDPDQDQWSNITQITFQSKEPLNPIWTRRIYWFLSCFMIPVIREWKWGRNASRNCLRDRIWGCTGQLTIKRFMYLLISLLLYSLFHFNYLIIMIITIIIFVYIFFILICLFLIFLISFTFYLLLSLYSLYYIILYYIYFFIFSVSYFFIYLFPVTKLSHLSESFLIISPFGFLHYLCIKFPTAARRL